MATANCNTKIKAWQHQKSGLWCIKRKGRLYYLGPTQDEAFSDSSSLRNASAEAYQFQCWAMIATPKTCQLLPMWHTDESIDCTYALNAPWKWIKQVTDHVRSCLLKGGVNFDGILFGICRG